MFQCLKTAFACIVLSNLIVALPTQYSFFRLKTILCRYVKLGGNHWDVSACFRNLEGCDGAVGRILHGLRMSHVRHCYALFRGAVGFKNRTATTKR